MQEERQIGNLSPTERCCSAWRDIVNPRRCLNPLVRIEFASFSLDLHGFAAISVFTQLGSIAILLLFL